MSEVLSHIIASRRHELTKNCNKSLDATKPIICNMYQVRTVQFHTTVFLAGLGWLREQTTRYSKQWDVDILNGLLYRTTQSVST